ncbi:NDP-hexose 2,3-dehydratase family protein, partial [uncultured Mailhella sp.]|uniref:NDP-hexose 2,3-dehydratase family protein n=1 Tax=uncultured Mailhella sp. TaxID=1981031 RepID=UPI00261ED8C5
MNNTLGALVQSWIQDDSRVNSLAELSSWIARCNAVTSAELLKVPLERCTPWFYDAAEGCIRNEKRSFFSIAGLRGKGLEQPIILQNEIGYLGILCREFDGVMHVLMQAKIEPGNVNCVQISPTIQATRSNFML